MGSVPCPVVLQRPVMSIAEVDEDTLREITEKCKVSPESIEDVYSCVPLQRSMIAEDRDEVFHFIMSFGPGADIDRFCECLRKVVAANAVLRTRLVRSAHLGDIVQVVTKEEHVTERHPGANREDVDHYLQQGLPQMGLGVPLLRSAFIGRYLVLTQHHAVFDYWSWDAMMNVDIASLYMQSPNRSTIPPQRPSFKAFVARCLGVDEREADAFWRSRFKGSPAVFLRPELPAPSRPRVVSKPDRVFPLDRIKMGALPPTHAPYYIEAAWALTASIHTDSDSVAYGYVLSGRTPTPDGYENTLGPTVTEVPMQVNLQRKTATVDRLIKDRAASIRQLHQNPHLMHYPIEKIAALSDAARSACAFSALFNVRPAVFASKTDDVEVKIESMIWRNGYFPLQLIFSITHEGVEVWPRVDETVLDDRQLDRLLNQFGHTLRLLTEAAPTAKLDTLPLLDPQGREEILRINEAIPEPVQSTLHGLFAARAPAQPGAMAVSAGDGKLTYAELDRFSSLLASALRSSNGVKTGTRVGLLMDRSQWAVVAMLAILKAGGTCVPIDRRNSEQSIANTLSTTGTRLVLVAAADHARTLERVSDMLVVTPEAVAETSFASEQNKHVAVYGQPEDPAFVFHASSSSGSGAGQAVVLEHHSLATSLTSQGQRLGWGPEIRMLHFWSLASGKSLLEIFGALLFGGCLCIPTPEDDDDLDSVASHQLSRFIRSAKVNFALLPPNIIRTLSPADVPDLRTLVSVGEPLQQAEAETYETWARSLRFFNGWGVTAASVLSTVREVVLIEEHTQLRCSLDNIGTPVGCAVWIVNPNNVNDLAPFGGVGELVIEVPSMGAASMAPVADNPKVAGGAGFMPPPRWASDLPRKSPAAGRFFRTGDLAKYDSDGSIRLVGRAGNRVKTSGGQVTVQLEEVERAIVECGGRARVRECAVAAKIVAGRTQVVALVCLADLRLPRVMPLRRLDGTEAEMIAAPQMDAVRASVQSRLQADRVPTIWIAVEKLPRTLSHKIDRVAVKEWLKALKR
ncbi:hypothetical protein C7999DRAFT_44387 [Corynascus novoguineensis]|uniref:Uncharacterized protein n=1 Tax=Corynascus novoguineensis TaxID=1126955 RepID=A0AAN7CKR3_9PEZI|nr:hypothetical protein C7999DRAFT_44387 [Corynascus novoguineensis]